MEIARAKAIADVAQVVINSAKVECDFIKLTDSPGSGFIPLPDNTVVPNRPRLVKGA